MKKALIFGIGGFVGPYLAKELQSHGYVVFGTDTRDCEDRIKFDGYFKCNILDKDGVRKIIDLVQPTHIFNLAAVSSVGQSWSIPEVTIQVNVNGTLNIFDGCLKSGIKPSILLVGSSEEYIPCNHPIDENTPISANNPYGISKVAQEQFATLYREKYHWDIFCVRSFNHTGIGQKTSFVVPNWCKQVSDIEKGLQEPSIKVGNLAVSRDFSDVRDIVSAYRLVIESRDSSQIFNIGSGMSYSLQSLLKFIISFSNKKIEIIVCDKLLRSNDNLVIQSDISKIDKLIGWKPKYAIKDTIRSIYEEMETENEEN
jgi:GDP-4-dehydro-6-deoxy-D-mannose reductase